MIHQTQLKNALSHHKSFVFGYLFIHFIFHLCLFMILPLMPPRWFNDTFYQQLAIFYFVQRKKHDDSTYFLTLFFFSQTALFSASLLRFFYWITSGRNDTSCHEMWYKWDRLKWYLLGVMLEAIQHGQIGHKFIYLYIFYRYDHD